MYLDLDISLQVGLYGKNWHQKLQCFEGRFMWWLDFKTPKPVIIFHIRVLNMIVCEHFLIPLRFPLPHFLQYHRKDALIFFESEVLAPWKPFIWKNSSDYDGKHGVETIAKCPCLIKHISSRHLKFGVYKSHITSSMIFSIPLDYF